MPLPLWPPKKWADASIRPKTVRGEGGSTDQGKSSPDDRERFYLRYLAFAAVTQESLAAPDKASHFSIATL